MTTVAINGFGRIGRAFLRAWLQREDSTLRVVAINDLADGATLAHLFRYDSTHGRWPGSVVADRGRIGFDRHSMALFREPDPANLPWDRLGIDVVLEATGRFTERAAAAAHLDAGADTVVVSAPSPDADAMFVVGINEGTYDPERHRVVSNASCTANCAAPLIETLRRDFGWIHGYMNTVHPVTSDQRLVDAPHADLRRSRAAGVGIIPTTSSAIPALQKIMPDLVSSLDGGAFRVPTTMPAVVDLVATVSRATNAEEVNAAFRRAARRYPPGVVAVSDEPLVAADYVGDPHAATVDALSTTVTNGTLVHVTAWYDNETGYANRCVDLLRAIAGSRPSAPRRYAMMHA